MEVGSVRRGSDGDESDAPRSGARKFEPLDVRIALHEKAVALRQKGCTYRQIADTIERDSGIRLCKKTISNWTRGKTNPIRAGRSFVAKPTPELAYVIGVETGDGFLNVKAQTYQYRIRLRAVNREFVEAFNQAVAKVLGCPPHKLWKGEKARETEVEFGSYLLHKFLSQKLDDLKPFIEYDRSCAASFIRGFFDSEGSVNTREQLTASNTDLNLLHYVQELLRGRFGIETTGPHLRSRKGSILTNRGKSYYRKANCYDIYVLSLGREVFFREIGLTIRRKSNRVSRQII